MSLLLWLASAGNGLFVSRKPAFSSMWPLGYLRLHNNASSIDTSLPSGVTCRSIIPTIDDILVNIPAGRSFQNYARACKRVLRRVPT